MEAGWLLDTIKVLSFFIGANPLPYLGMLFWLVFSAFYVRRAFTSFSSVNVVLLQFIPFIFTALGLLGTVAGALTVAWNVDLGSLTDAAKDLFKGILGAGASTMVGLILAMVFSKLVNMTQLKEEQQKALQNRELFVLKKILKLMKADYDRDAIHNAQYKDGFKSLQDLLVQLQQDNNAQSLRLEDALQRPGEQMAQEMASLRSELAIHFKSLLEAQNHQNRLLDQVRETLVSEEENGIPGRLMLMQQQSQNSSQYLEQRITGMQTALQQEAKTSASVLHQALNSGGKELVETIREGNEALVKQNDELILELGSLHETADATRQELVAGLNGLQKSADELPSTLEIHNRRLLKTVAVKSDAVMEKIAESDKNTAEDLGAIVYATEEQTRNLQGLIEAASAGISQSRGQIMDKLQAILLSHQNHAQDSSELVTSMSREITRQFKSSFSAAEQQQLQTFLSFFQERLATFESVTEKLGSELKTALDRNSGHIGQVHLAAQEQRDELAGIARQIQNVGNAAQDTQNKVQQLVSDSRQWVENGKTLTSLAQQVKSTETAVHSLDRAMEKLQQLSRQRNDGNGLSFGPVFAGASGYAAIKDELSRSINALLQRLREVEDIKKTDSRFWKQVQRQIHDGIPIIMGGNKLDLQHSDDLDAGFRDRLNQSFVNLDRMLETIVQGYKKRSNGNGNGNGAHARTTGLMGQDGQRIRLS